MVEVFVLVLVLVVMGVAEKVVLRGALLPVDCRVAAIFPEERWGNGLMWSQLLDQLHVNVYD